MAVRDGLALVEMSVTLAIVGAIDGFFHRRLEVPYARQKIGIGDSAPSLSRHDTANFWLPAHGTACLIGRKKMHVNEACLP